MKIPNRGTNMKRSFIKVPILNKRFEDMEKVAQNIKIPKDIIDLFFNPRIKIMAEKITIAIESHTKGFPKSVIAICFG